MQHMKILTKSKVGPAKAIFLHTAADIKFVHPDSKKGYYLTHPADKRD